MTYAVKQDMIDRFGAGELIELTDRADPPAGAIDLTVLNASLADADDIINSYLASRYTLPLSPAPAVLTRLACDIARYALYDDQASEQVQKRRDDAVAFLKDVSAGKATLGLDTASDEVQADAPVRTSTPGDRIFDRDTLAEFK